MSRLHSLAYVAAFFMLVALLLCGGCAPMQPSIIHTAAGTATGQLQSAHADLAAVKTHTKDQYVIARTESADESILAVLKSMPIFEQAADALAKAQAQIADWSNWWLGPRFWRNFYRVLTVMGILGVVQVILFFVAGTSPVGVWKVGAAVLGRIIGFINVGVGYIITWIHSHLQRKEAVKQAQAISLISPPGPLASQSSSNP